VSKIDLNIVWDDAKAMGGANRDLLTAIAGMFLLLPGIVAEQFIVMPQALAKGASNEQMLMRLADYASANWPVLLSHSIVTSFGILALQSLLLRPERLTVGESLRAAFLVLPGYIVANILQGFGIMAGMMLFFLPGFYLIGRLALLAAVAAAEGEGNPIAQLRRSVELTRGNGWRVFGVLAIIFVVMMIISLVITSLTGAAAELALPQDIANFAMSIVSSLLETALTLVVVLVTAAVYRSATAPAATVWQP
jgi:hypothetical protein